MKVRTITIESVPELGYYTFSIPEVSDGVNWDDKEIIDFLKAVLKASKRSYTAPSFGYLLTLVVTGEDRNFQVLCGIQKLYSIAILIRFLRENDRVLSANRSITIESNLWPFYNEVSEWLTKELNDHIMDTLFSFLTSYDELSKIVVFQVEKKEDWIDYQRDEGFRSL